MAHRHLAPRLGADARLDVLGGLLALGRQLVDGLLQLFLELCDLGVDVALQLLGLRLVVLAQLARLGVDVGAQAHRPLVLVDVQHREHVLPDFLVDVGDDVVREVEDLLQVAGRHVEQQAHAARDALEVPDVADRRGELDVAHALAAHLGPRHLDAALVADDALVAVALVLSAVAFPVPGGTEDALAEKAVALRAERAVVDRLGLRDLAVRPRHDRVGRSQGQLQRVKVLEFQQPFSSSSLSMWGYLYGAYLFRRTSRNLRFREDSVLSESRIPPHSAESSPSSSRSRLMPRSSGISVMSSSERTI